MTKIAFLGLGAMGSRMAARLVAEGLDVTVWNRTSVVMEPLLTLGCQPADTPGEAAKEADFVISMVRDNVASRNVWLDQEHGVLTSIKKGAIAIEMSTLSPDFIEELSRNVIQRGAELIDAPVAGSRPQAEAGSLIIMAGGKVEVLDRAKPVLSLMGKNIYHAGLTGSGSILKLVVNTLFGIQAVAMAELIRYLGSQKLEETDVIKILSELPVTSPAASGVAKQMIANEFTPMFPIELVAKDFSYFIQSARAGGLASPVAEVVHSLFTEAVKKGYGDDHISGIIQLETK